MFRFAKILLIALTLSTVTTAATPAQACPMCKAANETDQTPEAKARPKAYMMSILFMLAMPATLLSGFGISFYRLSKKQEAINAELLSGDDSTPSV